MWEWPEALPVGESLCPHEIKTSPSIHSFMTGFSP